MKNVIYFDTSALAKWYINEAHSDDVEKYLQKHGPVAISDLTIVEMRCLLARRRRDKSITAQIETEAFATLQEDIRRRFLTCHPLPEGLAAGTINLIALLPGVPIRTLDAMHLMIAKEISATELVTADRTMADGAEALGIKVIRF